MAKSWKKTGLMVSLLFLVLALLASDCAPGVPVGEAKKGVVVADVATLTGPIATNTLDLLSGYKAYIDYINMQGGIDGVKIKRIWRDTGARVPDAIIAHRRFVEKGVVLELCEISSQVEGITPSLQKDGIPLIWGGPLTKPMVSKPQWVFAAHASIASQFAFAMKWLKDTWVEARPPRAGAIIWDLASGWGTIEGIEEYAKKIGVEFVGYEVIPFLPAPIDTSVQWLRLVGKHPDLIFVTAASAPVVVVMMDARRLGIPEKGIKLFVYGESADERTLDIVGEAGDGWYTVSYTPYYVEKELPGMPALLETFEELGYLKLGGKAIRLSITGWIAMAVGIEGIRLARERVGLENLTGRAIRDALVTVEGFETGLLPPLSLGEKRPYYNPRYRIYQARGGDWFPVGDWEEYKVVGIEF